MNDLAWTLVDEIEHDWSRSQEIFALWDSTNPTEYLRLRLNAVLKQLPDGKRRNEVLRAIERLNDAT